MSDPFYPLVVAAAELKLAAPREFDNFIEAFKALEDRTRTELIAAEPNVIFAAQGKAWLVAHLRKKLEDCLQIKRTTEARK